MNALSRFPDEMAGSFSFEDFQHLLHPLTELSDPSTADMLDVRRLEIDGHPMPEPYRGLLVHDTDMTSTLETFHRERPRLEVLARLRRGTGLFRKVLLRGSDRGHVMEYGAIRIELDVLPSQARFAVLEGSRPLGGILGDHRVEFISRPESFFSLKPSPSLQRTLGLDEAVLLYGRKNFLLTGDEDVLAEVVEILPPAPRV